MPNPIAKRLLQFTSYEDMGRNLKMEDIVRMEMSLLEHNKTLLEYQLTMQRAAQHDDEQLKKEKRKLKKGRQKQKKNQAKPKLEDKTEDDANKIEQVAKNETDYTDIELQEQEDEDSVNMSDKNDSDSADIDISTEESAFIQSVVNQKDIVKKQQKKNDCGKGKESSKNLIDRDNSDSADIDFSTEESAFIQSIVNQKDIVKKQQKKNDCGKGKESSKNLIHKPDPIVTNDDNGFTSVKKGTKHTPTFCKTPEGFGNEALRLIRENELKSAIQFLDRGIALDRSDSRQYINRSYCYLRLGKYEEALADIKLASSHFTDIYEMSRAKCREGQALAGLQDYEAAELAFRESINLAPHFLFAKRELKRTQIMRILDMGFKEHDAILALKQKTTTMDAITLLSEKSLTTDNNFGSESPNEDDDEIFYSDTEEDPSNVRLLSKLLKYNPNMPEEPNHCKLPQTPSQDLPLRIFKAVAPAGKSKNINQAINSMAVWVGSLTPAIKDEMIMKRFSRFGKVVNVWRGVNDVYAFVNFQSLSAVQKALDEATFGGGVIEVNGFKLPIKPATNKNKISK